MSEPTAIAVDQAVLGVSVEVTHETGAVETVNIKPFAVAEYPAARAVVENEFRLVELAAKKPKGWVETLTPRSYDELAVAVQGTNQYFFDSCTRATLSKLRMTPEGLLSAARGAAGR